MSLFNHHFVAVRSNAGEMVINLALVVAIESTVGSEENKIVLHTVGVEEPITLSFDSVEDCTKAYVHLRGKCKQ